MDVIISLENLEKVLWYVLVPLIVVLLCFYLFIFIYDRKTKKKDAYHNYVINYIGNVISIIFGAAFLGVTIGFSCAFIQTLTDYGMVQENQFLYYLVLFFSILPLIFFLFFIGKFIKNLKRKEELDRKEQEL